MGREAKEMKEKERLSKITNLDELMDTITEGDMSAHLVYTAMIKAWDIGYVDGYEDAKEAEKDASLRWLED